MISEFHLLRPWWLLALLVPPTLLWLVSRSADIRSRWKGMIAPHLLDRLVVEPDHRRQMGPAWMMATLMVLAVLGAAGPTWQREPPPFVSDTASLVVLVDLSTTMDAADITPSRLERAKLKIHDLLAARTGARTAVVAYAGTAHLVVPLTDDASLVETYSDALSTRLMPKQGKDTAAALKLADNLLKGDGSVGTILLLTDGIEDDVANAARDIGNGLIVLGLGTPDDGLDLAALRQFGSKTGAAVATVTEDDTDVRWISEYVKTDYSSHNAAKGDRWRDDGRWLVAPAALVFAFFFRRGWVVKIAALLVVSHVLLPGTAAAGGWQDAWWTPDQQGRIAFERGDPDKAATHFRDPMWKGVALYRAGKFDMALNAFDRVDTAQGWFNRGNTLIQLGRFDQAIGAYGTALEKHPAWPEAEANLVIATRLAKAKQDQETEEQPEQKPDSIQFDKKAEHGKASKVEIAEQTSEMWMRNIQVSPADLLARRFAIEDSRGLAP